MNIKSAIEKITLEAESLGDLATKTIVTQLLNLIEMLANENKALREENQRLRDENNRLKGEHGKPSIRRQAQSQKDISSEKERKLKNKQKQKQQKLKKKNKLTINRTELCQVEPSLLPADAVFKGYQSLVVQDIAIKLDNVEFKKELYYSPSLKKTWVAPTPVGYRGEFGPTIKALILDMHHNAKTTESAIHRFLQNHGVLISMATISRIITDGHEPFHQEKKAIVEAGISSSIYQQMDDTGARVNGKNGYTHILCNEFYTAYFTRPHKDRLTVIELLTQGELTFVFNDAAYALMEQLNLSEKSITLLKQQAANTALSRMEVDALLNTLFPDPLTHKTTRRIIVEASAIAAYQQLPHAVQLLLTDDAPQFKQITKCLALCWVHDARHYKKLEPIVPAHRALLDNVLEQYWIYYHKLLAFKQSPTSAQAKYLADEFDALFSTKTGYDLLDERIQRTELKKDALLQVLRYPALPLHNNASELGARTQARYRDISLHTINEKGTQAKDTFMTLVETAKKLAVNTYRYFYDRISQQYLMPSLASLILSRSADNVIYNSA